MLKIAIIGCGKIADDHVHAIGRIQDCTIVGLCDREPLMAKQLGERCGLSTCTSDVDELLRTVNPDVVHITTPPQTHFEVARRCLEYGCHVYVEKPFTVNALEAERLIELATRLDRKITVGNDCMFTNAAMACRKLVRQGFLGGAPVHMESFYCYELQGRYAGALLGDRNHWVRQLPGKLLQNIISHGIVRIAEYLQDDNPTVIAHGFTSPLLEELGEEEIVDELRVVIADKAGATAYFTFSSQMRPSLHQFRVYGPVNGLVLDDDEHSLIKLYGKRYKSYAQKFIPSFNLATQHLCNLKQNLTLFLRRDFHMKAGMKNLMERFYRSITEGEPVPISYRDIVLTCKIMDSIFTQTQRNPIKSAPRDQPEDSISITQLSGCDCQDVVRLAPA